MDIPSDPKFSDTLAVEPRYNGCSDPKKDTWLSPSIVNNIAGSIRVCNTTCEPVVLKRHVQFAQVSPVFTPDPTDTKTQPHTHMPEQPSHPVSAIQVDPDSILPASTTSQFRQLHDQYQDVFNPQYEGYNGAAGKYEAVVNMGPVQPPQRKGRLPLYNKSKLVELQQKCDKLESLGALRRPENIGVVAEYLSPSFLVKKPSGDFRLVTAFSDVGRYSKPQPALIPIIDSTLQQIAQWKFIIVSDLTSAFYQIPLSKPSMRYCGIVTPYRGVRVYMRTAMGMPGSETALEELVSCLR